MKVITLYFTVALLLVKSFFNYEGLSKPQNGSAVFSHLNPGLNQKNVGIYTPSALSLQALTTDLPGQIEAENFDAMSGVQTEPTTDEGGGRNVKAIDNNDWMDYNVNVPTSGAYTVAFRVSNMNGNSQIDLRSNSGAVLGTAIPTNTGGYQIWATVRAIVNLSAGNQTLRVFAVKGAFNFNWMSITPVSYKNIPDQYEAESFDASKGILTEATADTGGGMNIKAIDDNDWLDYCVSVPSSGLYTVKFRVASPYTSGKIELRSNSGATLSSVNVSQTGGWQNWTTISTTVNLTAGKQALRVYAAKGGFNFNWFALSAPSGNDLKAIPGRIEAENYDANNGVQTEGTQDEGGGQNVKAIDDNDWMDYYVNVASSGSYTVYFRVATSNASSRFELRSANGTALCVVRLPRTGNLQSWVTVSANVDLNAGSQTIRLYAVKGAFTLNWIDFASASETTAYKAIPGKLEAESFDAMNGVVVEPTSDAGGGLGVGSIDDNDWLDYNVNVASAGKHTFKFRLANQYGKGRIDVRTNTGDVLCSVDVPVTGGWQNWQDVSVVANLSEGSQTLRIYAVRGAFNFNYVNVAAGVTATVPSVIDFPALSDRPASTTPFDLIASSTNTATPITFTSSNPSVVSVSNASGTWKATAVATGTATITASQLGNDTFLDAAPVSKSQVVLPPSTLTLDRKIPIDGSRWYQLNNISNGLEGLFDGKTNETVLTGWGKLLANFDAYYPLANGESMTIESIKFFSGQGHLGDTPLTLSIITDKWQRIPIATFVGGVYNAWVGPYPTRKINGDGNFKLDTPISNARYLVINSNSSYPNEIELYGSYVAGARPTAVPAKQNQLKDMFGINAFEWDFEEPNDPHTISESKWKAAKYFTGFRHYMDWQKLELTEGSYTFNPTYSGGWNYDAIYERCKAEGKTVLACLKTIPDWINNTYPNDMRDNENVPLRYGKDFTNPTSYIEQARIAFQFAARYGSNPNVDRSLLSVNAKPRWTNDPINTVKVGMDLIKYIECDNERDKWWKGRKAYQTGREYAANMSAFYDGHKNTMGRGIGVKNADPNMQVVMGGLALATMGTDYVAGMIDWCKQYRGYKADGRVDLCWDVINYHLYADDANSSQSGTSKRGVAPEVSVEPAVARKFLELAHNAAYDMPVWVTETGYDINQGSPLKAIPIGNKSVIQTQADWILRTALLYVRLGIDKVFFYQMYSENLNSSIQFSSQGLINADKSPTPAASFLYQTNKLIGDYTYKETINNDPVVDRYELNGQSAYMLVVPDEKGRTANYTLNLGGGVSNAVVYTPKAGSDEMDKKPFATDNGNLTLTVSETPIFVLPGTGTGRLAASEENIDKSLASTNLYPNPAVDEIAISLTNASMDNVDVTILDGNIGRIHQQVSLPKSDRSFVHKLSISSLPFGLYVVEIKQGANKVYRKMIKVQ